MDEITRGLSVDREKVSGTEPRDLLTVLGQGDEENPVAKTEDQPAQRREPGDSLGAKGRGSDQLGQSDATERPSKMRTGPRTEVTGDLDRNIHTQPNSVFVALNSFSGMQFTFLSTRQF